LIYSRIAGTGSYLPKKIITNFDLEKMVDTTDEWIRTRTGIERRHVAADGETTVDLAEHAARRALEAAGVAPQEVDFIAFSLETACAGFMYALSIADKYVRCGEARRALVVGAETLSRITDWSDRATAVLFADGAGAVVLEPAATPGVLSTHLHSDGEYHDMLYCGSGVSKGFEPKLAIRMSGTEVFKVAVTKLGQVVDETLAANGLERTALDWLVPHQANIRIVQATARKLEMPMERVIVTVQDHGNTSAASVPMALDVAVRDGRIRRGELLLLEAFGGGFTWGSALVRY
jgi:3-oxoacyl-[acyl-carrier-protein] synthase-3